MTPSHHSTRTGSWILLIAGISIVCGTLSPASTDVKAETASVPYINGLVNPAYANLPLSARELPEKRTEKTAVFQMDNQKFAAISFGTPMFTKVDDKWLPIDQTGHKEGNSYIFDRLAEGVTITFDLTKPQYTLTQNGQGFTVVFVGNAHGKIIDDHSIEYTLADGITLTWTVDGNHVHKNIVVTKKGVAQTIAFTITPIGDLHVKKTDNQLVLLDAQKKDIFLFDTPFLARADGTKLTNSLDIKQSENHYYYDFDESTLPVPYAIDPSSGPNSPGTMANDASIGTDAWTNPENATASDNSYARVSGSPSSVDTSNYLKATAFGFSISGTATINGITVEIEHSCSNQAGYSKCDDATVELVKGGTISGNNNADTSTDWPVVDAYETYGTSSDLWGLTLTPSDINASNFGIVLSVALTQFPAP